MIMVRAVLTPEQFAQLVCFHPDDREDIAQSPFGHVATGMDRNWDGPSIGMPHHVWLPLTW